MIKENPNISAAILEMHRKINLIAMTSTKHGDIVVLRERVKIDSLRALASYFVCGWGHQYPAHSTQSSLGTQAKTCYP